MSINSQQVMSEPSQQVSNDPWETPPVYLDPELIETSKRLMAKSISPEPDDLQIRTPGGQVPPPEAKADTKDILIAQLEQEKQRLFQRNVYLVSEATRLRVENQHLLQQVSEQNSQNWLTRFLKQFSQSQQKN